MSNALDVIVSELNDKILMVENALSLGRANSYDEYKYLCGEIRGLLTARDIVKDLKNRMENEDE
jgi:hypothetical protein